MVHKNFKPIHLIASSILCSASIGIAGDKITDTDTPEHGLDFSGTYVIKTQMIMPNLEEGLRYANTTVTQCLNGLFAGELFPILSHQSLQGCKLIFDSQNNNSYQYNLSCPGTNQTQGNAKIVSEGSVFEWRG